MEITIESGLAEVAKKRVRYIWKMDRSTYRNCQRLKDEFNAYGWVPDLKLNGPGTFLGYQISLVDDESFELVIVPPAEAQVLTNGAAH